MRLTELAALDIEALMNVKVISAAKKEQKQSEAAAAIYVITQEDIRRSGVTSIPEALRMVPGLQVAQLDANKWAVSARGFNGRFANKLLVLIDGRSVYTPLFSGVYWDVQDTLMEDIERIELIRGPGATLWGANAVNGVINIITKKAGDTQGTLLTGGGGSEEQGFGGVRHGGALGEDAYYRIYFKYFNRDSLVVAFGDDAEDDWSMVRGGFRIDWEPTREDTLTLQGDLYDGEEGVSTIEPTLLPPFMRTSDSDTDVSGGNVLSRWSHTFSDTSDMSLQFYYDRTERRATTIEEDRDTLDVEFQHRVALSRKQEIVWGAGYRFTQDDIEAVSDAFTVEPGDREDNLVSVFIQDEVDLVEDTLRFIVGSKFEYNEYTGFEVQPNARMVWNPAKKHTVWGAISKAVRTPSRAEEDFEIDQVALPPGSLGPGSPPTLVRLQGDEDFESEELIAYELGYRVMPLENLSIDIAAFFNVYDNLRTLESGTPAPEPTPAPAHLVVPTTIDNKMDGETYGVEVATEWRVRKWWHLRTAYSYLGIRLELDGDSADTTSEEAEGQSPEHQVSLRSSMDLPGNFEFDSWFRYVDWLPALEVDSYVTIDLRLGWLPTENVEFSIVAQNLLDGQRPESSPVILGGVPSEVERGVYAKITIRL